MIDADHIASQNTRDEVEALEGLDHLRRQCERRGLDLEAARARLARFEVAIPSWGVGTGGTRFARFPMGGEPRSVHEKLADCAVVQQLVRCTPRVSLHFPWDRTEDPAGLREEAAHLGLGFDAVNSNTFQDQAGAAHSYKFGSLTHTDPGVRRAAVEHNLACIEAGVALGSRALTVWIADGSNFPGQQDLSGAFERYLASMEEVVVAAPEDWAVLLEHKLYEPAFYSTVVSDWGTSLLAAQHLGPKARCLVDLGHHAPSVNIEQIVARLVHAGKLGGFHFNDSKYGDDDLDAGSIQPFQLFLVCHELVLAERRGQLPEDLATMMDQSHNVTDPLESLMLSAVALQRAFAQALLVDHAALAEAQEANDALLAAEILRRAFRTDVDPLLAAVRQEQGGALDPLSAYRTSGYRARIAGERPGCAGRGGGGIV
jgi:L-rhamnose isomerase/sugar isomerase